MSPTYLPEGQRRDRLQLAIDAMIDQDFQGRVLPFDTIAARPYAEIAAQRRAAGAPYRRGRLPDRRHRPRF